MSWIAALTGHIVFALVLGWCVARRGSANARVIACVLTGLTGFAAPFAMPESWAPLRFFAFIACIGLFTKVLETARETIESPEMGATLGRYLLWASILPNTTWYGDKEQKRRHQRAAIGGLMRGVGALVAVVGLLALHDAVPLQYSPWSDAFWMMWLFYFFTVACLTLLALPLQLLGIAVAPVLRVPPLARSPRDFWGRRWNLWFTRLAHIHVFTPLGGAKRPMRASAAVFLISALSHEAMTWVSLGQIDGRMFLFFTMHGVATMATGALGTSLGRRELMPRALAVPLHLTWLAATAPLFFGPINDIFQLTAWPAWVWNILGI